MLITLFSNHLKCFSFILRHNLWVIIFVGVLITLLRVGSILPTPPNPLDLLVMDVLRSSNVRWTSMTTWCPLVSCPPMRTVSFWNFENGLFWEILKFLRFLAIVRGGLHSWTDENLYFLHGILVNSTTCWSKTQQHCQLPRTRTLAIQLW